MSEEFKQDLKMLESEGAPLWDGFATLSVRPASEEEIEEFEEADLDEDDEEDSDEEDGPLIMFLVDVIEPDDSDA
jgi:hypothetical protein